MQLTVKEHRVDQCNGLAPVGVAVRRQIWSVLWSSASWGGCNFLLLFIDLLNYRFIYFVQSYDLEPVGMAVRRQTWSVL